ncbi:hypothetical protein K1719_034817 [Acacia pycnantha]|nr:hypothetical protein K1719_034817 [Acacia pycnantha]
MMSLNAVEVDKAVQEVADVAWTVVECSHHLRHHDDSHSSYDENDENLKSLRSENCRLRSLLEKNQLLLLNLSQSPSFLNDCPPDNLSQEELWKSKYLVLFLFYLG